jgi:hypothetical protein
VETVETDLKNSEVSVKGVYDPAMLVEYMYKRFGKHSVIMKEEKVEEEVQQVIYIGLNKVGPNIGPAIVLGQREGKQVMVVEEPNDKLLKGGTSIWATRVTSP